MFPSLILSDRCRPGRAVRPGLRKDWARQKKTIEQLVRDADGEDRQVSSFTYLRNSHTESLCLLCVQSES